MPTRILRDGILKSRAVNSLTEEAELFYRRLISVVDDFGRTEMDLTILRSDCFPRRMETWPIVRIEQCLSQCTEAYMDNGEPLITIYEMDFKKYLQINNFGQRTRDGRAYKCPPPPDLAAKCGDVPPKAEAEAEAEPKAESVFGGGSDAAAAGEFALTAPTLPKKQRRPATVAQRVPPDARDRLRLLADACPNGQELEPGIDEGVRALRRAESPQAELALMEANLPRWFDAMRAGEARNKSLMWIMRDRDYVRPPPAAVRKPPAYVDRARQDFERTLAIGNRFRGKK